MTEHDSFGWKTRREFHFATAFFLPEKQDNFSEWRKPYRQVSQENSHRRDREENEDTESNG